MDSPFVHILKWAKIVQLRWKHKHTENRRTHSWIASHRIQNAVSYCSLFSSHSFHFASLELIFCCLLRGVPLPQFSLEPHWKSCCNRRQVNELINEWMNEWIKKWMSANEATRHDTMNHSYTPNRTVYTSTRHQTTRSVENKMCVHSMK